MKVALFTLAFVTTAAFAGIMGTLTKSETANSPTGKLVWVCTYDVAGKQQTVTLEKQCPQTMQFD